MHPNRSFRIVLNKRVVTLLVFSLIIRLVYVTTPYGWNEEVYVKGMRDLVTHVYRDPSWLFYGDVTNLFQVGPVFYLIHLPVYTLSRVWLLPDNITMHIMSSVLGVFGVYLVYLLSRRILSENVAFLSSLCVSVFPVYWMVTRHLNTENASIPFLLISIFILFDYFNSNERKHLLSSAIAFGLSFMSRYDVILMLPVFLVFIIYLGVKNKQDVLELIKRISIFILPTIIFSLPLVIFSLIRLGIIFPVPNWISIFDTTLSGGASYDYQYSTRQLFSLYNFYIACFSLPFIPSFIYTLLKRRMDVTGIIIVFSSILILFCFGLTADILVRPSLTEFGINPTISGIVYILMSLLGFLVIISLVFTIKSDDIKSKFLSLWAVLFISIWFFVVRRWQIQPRYFIISAFPIILLGFKFTIENFPKRLAVSINTVAIAVFFIVGIVLNQWATASWFAMYESSFYLKENMNSTERALFSPTHGFYSDIYFEPSPFEIVRPDWYHRWESYRTSIKYVVYDTSNYYLVNQEIREFLEHKQELLEYQIDVKMYLPLIGEVQIDTIRIYRTEGILLPEASKVNYYSDYFV